jgi:hypothetical protein
VLRWDVGIEDRSIGLNWTTDVQKSVTIISERYLVGQRPLVNQLFISEQLQLQLHRKDSFLC